MAKSIKLDNDTFWDASEVMMRSNSATYRKTLDAMLGGIVGSMYTSINANTPTVFTLGNSTRAILFTMGTADMVHGIYQLRATSGGAALQHAYVAASGISFTASGNTITITSIGNTQMLLFVMSGSVSVS